MTDQVHHAAALGTPTITTNTDPVEQLRLRQLRASLDQFASMNSYDGLKHGQTGPAQEQADMKVYGQLVRAIVDSASGSINEDAGAPAGDEAGQDPKGEAHGENTNGTDNGPMPGLGEQVGMPSLPSLGPYASSRHVSNLPLLRHKNAKHLLRQNESRKQQDNKIYSYDERTGELMFMNPKLASPQKNSLPNLLFQDAFLMVSSRNQKLSPLRSTGGKKASPNKNEIE